SARGYGAVRTTAAGRPVIPRKSHPPRNPCRPLFPYGAGPTPGPGAVRAPPPPRARNPAELPPLPRRLRTDRFPLPPAAVLPVPVAAVVRRHQHITAVSPEPHVEYRRTRTT